MLTIKPYTLNFYWGSPQMLQNNQSRQSSLSVPSGAEGHFLSPKNARLHDFASKIFRGLYPRLADPETCFFTHWNPKIARVLECTATQHFRLKFSIFFWGGNCLSSRHSTSSALPTLNYSQRFCSHRPITFHYNLRQRSHSLTLPSEDNNLIRKNFLHRMLFRDIY